MIFPEFSNFHIIDQLRNMYDPLANLVKPHVTLVFPFESSIGTSNLANHIKCVLNDVEAFDLKLTGIYPHTVGGNYLFLKVVKGYNEIKKIHDNLYSSFLERFHNEMLPYIPHLTVGKISDDIKFQEAIQTTKDIHEVFETKVRKVSVEVIGDEGKSEIVYEYNFRT